MARARVTLKEGSAYKKPGEREWKKGKPVFLTDAAEIERYRTNSRFEVIDLPDAKPKAKKKAAAPKTPTSSELPADDPGPDPKPKSSKSKKSAKKKSAKKKTS